MYRKRFDAPPGADRGRVFLDFAAAMTRATVTLNGAEVTDHLGGYLPFRAEISGLLRPAGNVLAVRLDSTFNLNVPPDRPAPEPSVSVDYWQPGGIYRDVRLRLLPRAFLADVFAKPVNVLDPAARQVVVQVTVDAAAGLSDPAHGRVHDIAASDDRYCGLLAWTGFDYPSGSGNQYRGVKYTGVVDEFRVPKPGAAIYQAQADPRVRPVIAPAFYWDFGVVSPVNALPSAMICANLDRLEIYVGGEHFATVLPDTAGYPHLDYPRSRPMTMRSCQPCG
jgi:hypothetical protein